MSKEADMLANSPEQIVDTRVAVTYHFLTEPGGDIIKLVASSRAERQDKMPLHGVDPTRPYAFGHLADHGPSKYQVAGTHGDLIAELRRRLNTGR